VKSMWQESTRRELQDRLARLTPGQAPGWGKFSAAKMIVHVTDTFRSATGELAVAPKRLPLRYPPLKQVVVYWLPFPKNSPTAPELLAGTPGEWPSDVSGLLAAIERFAKRDRDGEWPEHAAFGRLTGEQWGVLMYRHTDHHFKQFGI
jgi:hypothetical protein